VVAKEINAPFSKKQKSKGENQKIAKTQKQIPPDSR
jgi:hypothetical protein